MTLHLEALNSNIHFCDQLAKLSKSFCNDSLSDTVSILHHNLVSSDFSEYRINLRVLYYRHHGLLVLRTCAVNFIGCQPVRQRIVFKLAAVTYKALLSGLPAYLQCKIHDYHPSRTLCATSAPLLQQQPATISFAAKAFCAPDPTVWNSLGVHTHSADTFFDIEEPA